VHSDLEWSTPDFILALSDEPKFDIVLVYTSYPGRLCQVYTAAWRFRCLLPLTSQEWPRFGGMCLGHTGQGSLCKALRQTEDRPVHWNDLDLGAVLTSRQGLSAVLGRSAYVEFGTKLCCHAEFERKPYQGLTRLSRRAEGSWPPIKNTPLYGPGQPI